MGRNHTRYDGLGRRETNSAGLSFQHDGSAMIGWSETGASYSFLTLPGGGTLAGSYTANGTTATWVPLIDASGSTLGLVNAANVAGGAVTTYTYDPSGTPTRNGATNLWPFLYKGLEQETIDAPYYYTGSGQFYSPQMVRSLSGAGETGTSGARGFSPAGMTLPLPSVSSAGLSPQSLGNDTQQAFQVGTDIYNTSNQLGLSLDNGEFPLALPLAIIGGAVDFLVNFFEDFLGGGGSPEIPRQLLKNRHPLYPVTLGIQDGLITDEASAALIFSVPGIAPLNLPPLQKEPPGVIPVAFAGHTGCVPGRPCGPSQTEREPLTPSVCGNFFACVAVARSIAIAGCTAGAPEDVPPLCVPGGVVIGGIGCHRLFPCKLPFVTFPLPGPPSR